jgi:DNA polymerase elongation subunit (family B)
MGSTKKGDCIIEEQEIEMTKSSHNIGNWRKIKNITSKSVGFIDVMYECSNERGISLKDAAKMYLKEITKMEDDAVSYANLFTTWFKGDLIKFVTYCIIDVDVTYRLFAAKEIVNKYCGLSNASCLPMASLYTQQSVRTILNTRYCFSVWKDFLTLDFEPARNESNLYGIDQEITEENFVDVKPPGGRTCEGTRGLYPNLVWVVDFRAQYPSIIIAYNICTTSLVPDDIPTDLNIMNVFNVVTAAPVQKHVCETCKPNVKCKIIIQYVKIEKQIRFYKQEYMMSVGCEVATRFTALREKYKKIMKNSTGRLKEVYNSFQLAVKTLNNGQYGVLLRLSTPVGTTIPYLARCQNEIVAQIFFDKGMKTVNADTDSVMMIDTIKPPLSNLSLALKKSTPGSIARALNTRYEDLTGFLNHGDETHPPAYPAPAYLQYEKVFFSQLFLAKKIMRE